ncbi:Inactive transglutaminase fused to 7 transmembrane helices [Desulfonatronum thiosulfatophilum]|uniref:Inactive transglutaminase fused to 7 transmembrane helices n=1 Tax=Desulfonatronum thiosulfatophilum TaxID=617002 RepID=A0A1G6DJB8_9BACT|nr:inactive transglutaminase family protein [Desulfonatronum thiosulfatophilum]SDB45232.1 Inactive transglutaminase fused to 7 transmembrane helices [Desulfonatronum thiosulfatophilum]
MKRLHLPLLILALAAASLGIFQHKARNYGFPVLPAQITDNWLVEARFAFEPTGGAVTARLLIPHQPPGFGLLDEHFVSRGYGLTTGLQGDNREAIWTTRSPSGRQVVYYRTTVSELKRSLRPQAEFPGPADLPRLEEPYASAANAIVQRIREHSADITSFATVLMRDMVQAPDEKISLFVSANSDDRERVRAAIQLLAGARIPARMAHGLHLADRSRDLQPRTWLEVHNTREWVPISPTDGSVGYPANFLVWWYGDQEPVELSRARNAQVSFAVTRNFQSAVDAAQLRAKLVDSRIADFSLLGLPVQTQNMYRVLLMVPLGAMIIVLLRNVVGVQTFGTFMPVLIALSFRETELLGGVILFTLIVSLGLAIRFYLEHLKLLLVPRLAAVVIIVVILMLILSIVSHQLGIEHGLAVALFPMVILAMTIERMSVIWEENGAADAIRQGGGSMGTAIISYLLMINPYIEHLIFVFPELLLIVLAATLLLGRYKGYRLSELIRFRALAGKASP